MVTQFGPKEQHNALAHGNNAKISKVSNAYARTLHLGKCKQSIRTRVNRCGVTSTPQGASQSRASENGK